MAHAICHQEVDASTLPEYLSFAPAEHLGMIPRLRKSNLNPGARKTLKSSSPGQISRILVFAAVSCLVFAREAHAYLDPGSVSLFFQALVAGALGAMFLLKRFWTQIKSGAKDLFSGRSRNDET